MKHPNKHAHCLNCSQELDMRLRFCPACGQENTDYLISARVLGKELVSSLFNIDSRLAHSVVPFLFRPGFLPRAFMDGKRAHYVHPVRFYLFMSLLFFFAFPKALDGGRLVNGPITELAAYRKAYERGWAQSDSLLREALADGQIDSEEALRLRDRLQQADPFALDLDSMKNRDGIVSVGFSGEEEENLVGASKLMRLWNQHERLTPESLLDSLEVDPGNRSWLVRHAAGQLLKFAAANNPDAWQGEVLSNVPYMMFLMLPMFALLLKLFYMRRRYWYIEHLIFTLHIHAYAFFMLAMGILSVHWLGFPPEPVAGTLALILVIYPFLMFRQYYRQGFGRTLLKFLLVGWCYSLLLLFAIFLEISISFLTF